MRRRSGSPSRRRFLKTFPAAVSAAAAAPVLAQQAPARISKDVLECGETLMGVDFEPAETDLMLNLVNTNREHYEAIRRVPISPDVEPVFSYRPPRPKTAGKASPNSRVVQQRIAGVKVAPRLDQLAFEPAVRLGQLIAARAVSSTDLTRMYLDRLKSFDDRLHCVVTLAESTALEQAA